MILTFVHVAPLYHSVQPEILVLGKEHSKIGAHLNLDFKVLRVVQSIQLI